jgi:exopolyphosphatase/pppGpp-phosphohydrolase
MTASPRPHTLWQNALAAAAGGAVAVLQMGDQTTYVAAGTGPEPAVQFTLPLGARRTGTGEFKHDPPTAAEMELAIMTVEDEVMPLARHLPPGATLYTADAGIRQIAHIAGMADAPQMLLQLDDVERVYNLLAAVALGRPASISGVRTDPPFAATLTLLREFMHHLGFGAVVILQPDNQPG